MRPSHRILIVGVALLLSAERSVARPDLPQPPPGPTLITTLPWGDGPFELGRIEADESAPEGPQAITVGPDGTIHVLDTVHGEVLHLGPDGAPLWAFALPDGASAELIHAMPDGRIAVVDRLVERALWTFSPEGLLLDSMSLHWGALDEPSLVTAIRDDAGALWLEEEHGRSHAVPGTDGQRPRPSRVGRPLGPRGHWVRARRFGPTAISFVLDQDGALREAVVHSALPTLQFAAFEADGAGGHLLAFETLVQAGPHGEAEVVQTEVVHLDARGRELRRDVKERRWSPFEPLQPFARASDGALLQLVPTEDAVEIWRW